MEGVGAAPAFYRLKAGYLRFRGALYDRTTGLFALPFHFDRIRALLRDREAIGLIAVEAAGLDRIEARAGWQESDRLRARIASILAGTREAVLGPGTVAACDGVHGCEFLLFLPAASGGPELSEARLESLAESVREEVRRGLEIEPPSEWAGILHPEVGWTLLRDLPLARFERQVYQAVERARRNRIDSREPGRVRRIADLRRILEAGAVDTLFQPIASLETGAVVGYEALVRGPRDTDFEAPAALFFVSEQIGAATALDEVCRQRALAAARGLDPGLKLFLNSLPATIQGTAAAGEGWWAALEESRIPSDRIVLEITERNAIGDFAGLRRGVDRLRSRGVQVAIDDVGTGYSTLQAISELQPDFLKVDMSLIRNIDRSLIKRGMVSCLVEMGEKIRACIIAEGIERIGEMQALQECGVRYGQGFLLARPAPLFPTVTCARLRDS